MAQEINVDNWINCFSRAPATIYQDNFLISETTINGEDENIKNLTNNENIKKANFDLYKHKKAIPQFIDAKRYYDHYNINAIRTDISFLTTVYVDKEKTTPAKKRQSSKDKLEAAEATDEVETAWVSLKDIASSMAGSAGVSNNNNNFFVSMVVEDNGPFKNLTLTLIDRTFTTLAGHIYEAIGTGNGNVNVFGGDSETASDRRAKALEGSKEVTLAAGTNLTFLAPEAKKIKNNLRISYGYHIENNTPSPFFDRGFDASKYNSASKSLKEYWGKASHRWTSANTWSKDSQNENQESVNPGNVLQQLKHQTTEKIPLQEYFITDLETTLTNTGMIYTIKATNTESFELNNLKFMQQYTNLRGTPKRLLASLMNVFNSTEDAPVKLVWYDDADKATSYLNGSAVLKDYKTGNYILANEDSMGEVLEDERKAINDLKTQISVLNDLRALLTYNSNNDLKISNSPVFYNEANANAVGNFVAGIEEDSGDWIINPSPNKGQKYSPYLYAFRKKENNETKDSKNESLNFDQSRGIAWAHDYLNNNGYYGNQQRFGTDAKIEINRKYLAASWISLIGVKVYNLKNNFDYRSDAEEPYLKFKKAKLAYEAQGRLDQAGKNLIETCEKISWIEPVMYSDLNAPQSVVTKEGSQYYLGLNGCFGLVTAFRIPEVKDDGFDFQLNLGNVPGVNFSSAGNIRNHGDCGYINAVNIDFTLGNDLKEKDLGLSENKAKAYEYINGIWDGVRDTLKNVNIANTIGKVCLDPNNWNSMKTFCEVLEVNIKEALINVSSKANNLLKIYKNYKIYEENYTGKKALAEKDWNGTWVNTRGAIVAANGAANMVIPDGNYQICFKESPEEVLKKGFPKIQETFEKAVSVLNRTSQKITNGAGKHSWDELTTNIKKDGEYIKIFSGKDLSEDFIEDIFSTTIEVTQREENEKCLKKTFKFLKNNFRVDNIDNRSVKEVVEQTLIFLKSAVTLNEIYDTSLAGYKSNIAAEIKNFVGNESLGNLRDYIINSTEDALKEYAICLIDCYIKNLSASKDGAYAISGGYWEEIENDVLGRINSTNINFTNEQRKARIKKNGSKFEEGFLGKSYDGLEDYYQKISSRIYGSSKEDLKELDQKITKDLLKYSEDLDAISKEYDKNKKSNIGQPISISLGGEDSQDLSNVYSKSLSSLFNDFCNQCMPLAKSTDIVSTASLDQEGNQNTAVLTEDATNYHLTWSVVGKYKTKNGSYQPIVGFYYKQPSRPGYIRRYFWGTGNANQHIVKDLSIKASSEFAMFSSIKTINLANGSLKDYEEKDNTMNTVLNVSKIQETASKVEFPNFVTRNAKQKNIMNNLLKAINKGTITLLGDPSLVFVDEIQPYTYPIYLDIKLQQEGAASWSEEGYSAYEQSYLSGYYLVTKITHNISSSGYTTTLEVIKYPGLSKTYSI